MTDLLYSDPEYKLHQTRKRDAQRSRAILREDNRRRRLAAAAVDYVTETLQARGLTVTEQAHNERFDLSLSNGQRVEVKAATFRGRRYQANVRGNEADVLILACLDHGAWSCFIIPFDRIASQNIAVWSQDPSEYGGQWRDCLENWQAVCDDHVTG